MGIYLHLKITQKKSSQWILYFIKITKTNDAADNDNNTDINNNSKTVYTSYDLSCTTLSNSGDKRVISDFIYVFNAKLCGENIFSDPSL